MNPLIAKDIFETERAQTSIRRAEKIQRGVLVGASVVALGFIGWKVYKHYKSKQVTRDGAPDAVFAKRLATSFNPSGFDWMRTFDTTDLAEVFRAAFEIQDSKTDYSEIQKSYKNLTNRELDSDLRSELSPEDYAKFVNIVQNKNYKPKDDPENPNYYKNKAAIFAEEGEIFRLSDDFFAFKTIPAQSRISNASTTGNTQKVHLMFTFGIFGDDTRVELKTPDNVTFWVSMKTAKLVSSIDEVPSNYKSFKVV